MLSSRRASDTALGERSGRPERVRPIMGAARVGTMRTAPLGGAVAWHVNPGYQACTYTCRAVHPAGDRYWFSPAGQSVPRLASRGWSRVGARLPCPDASVRDTFLRRIGADA